MYEGSGTKVYDLSGNDNHGTLQSGTTWAAGQSGWSSSFPGSTANEVNCGVPLSGQTLKTMTIAGWMFRSSTANLVSFGYGDTSSNRFDILWFTDTNVYFQIENGSTNFPNVVFNQTGWHHFASVLDNGAQRAYIDGAKQTLTAGGSGTPSSYAITGNFRIGEEQSNSRDSNGQIDGVVLYNRALSDSEVAALAEDSWQLYRRQSWKLTVAMGWGHLLGGKRNRLVLAS